MAPKTTIDTLAARPFIKSAGGKTRLLPELRARMPKEFGAYYEPFVGGGALFWALASERVIQRATLGDTNAHLVAAYRAVRDDVGALVQKLSRMPNDEAFFYKQRVRSVDHQPDVVIAARMIYLNKTCFNGLYRVNRSGQMNTPFGRYKKPPICDAANLRACAMVMQRMKTRILHDSFDATIAKAEPGDFVYFDPPYWPVKKGAFVAYGPERFGVEEQVKLRDVARELKSKKVHVMLSNADVPEVRELYAKGFKVSAVEAPRSINAKGDGRGPIAELIIT